LKIVVDENIPYGKEVFGNLGSVSLIPGRGINSKSIHDATILIVRSVTKVNANLLRNSHVKFVGSATSGVDHVDQEYLRQNDILFSSASGENSNSVAEYVMVALLTRTSQKGISLRGKKLGIIGVGSIGRLVEKKATAIGMEIILNDPPLKRKTGESRYQSLQKTCDADFVTLHVPLIREGSDATYHLFNEKTISGLNPDTVVINTSRGEVIDNEALLQAILKQRLKKPVLDVWEGEPDINWDLLKHVETGTPHIAGYALEGKIKGTLFIYQSVCACLGLPPSCHLQPAALPETQTIRINAAGRDEREILSDAATQVYNLAGDGIRLRKLLDLPLQARPAAFDQLRRQYPRRREFHSTTVSLRNGSPQLSDQLIGLGFKTVMLDI